MAERIHFPRLLTPKTLKDFNLSFIVIVGSGYGMI